MPTRAFSDKPDRDDESGDVFFSGTGATCTESDGEPIATSGGMLPR